MAGFLLPLLLLVGGYIYYEKFGGREQIDSILGELKGGGGGNSGSLQGLMDQAKSRTGSWTDSKGNHFNNQSDTNTKSNVGGSGQITQTQKSTSFFTVPRIGNL